MSEHDVSILSCYDEKYFMILNYDLYIELRPDEVTKDPMHWTLDLRLYQNFARTHQEDFNFQLYSYLYELY